MIPASVTKLMERRWLEADADEDYRDAWPHQPSWYATTPNADFWLNSNELHALVNDGAIPSNLARRDQVQEHAAHSLQQFLHETMLAYDRHLARVERYAMRAPLRP